MNQMAHSASLPSRKRPNQKCDDAVLFRSVEPANKLRSKTTKMSRERIEAQIVDSSVVASTRETESATSTDGVAPTIDNIAVFLFN